MSTLEAVRGAATATFEMTRFTKAEGGLMTKVLTLNGDGTVTSDGSHCRLWEGIAERVNIASAAELAALIKGLRSDQAIALGRLRADLPAVIPVMTKANLVREASAEPLLSLNSRKGKPHSARSMWIPRACPAQCASRSSLSAGSARCCVASCENWQNARV